MDRFLEPLAHTLKWDALHDRIEEPFHDQPFGLNPAGIPRASR